ncbi:DegT/DnrJ/EryC1/StrS family aminotransferase [Haloarcula sp. GH36]|uniref:DegT/DnrJ/EryC1/StrS family aminotransferase n=1 Tax=Haloarcula montana TaxID=3111776 RepID=UPI002D771203|nr:DegT/DnrJ/EryC1/StrS family aminotransferase [Haloarcula sp. GH36]
MSEDRPAAYGGTAVRSDPLGYGGQTLGEGEKTAVAETLDADYITRGPKVDEFETDVAEFLGVDHAIATTSGTTALQLAGDALGFGPGDEIITTPLTFVSTTYPACHTGATPVFADIEPETRTLDPEAVEAKITDATEAIIPMHYAGHPADIDELLAIADRHDLSVLWDACHAFGTTIDGDPVGNERDLATFSFHPVKNITMGEGGLVATDDDEIAARVRSLRSFDMNYEPDSHEDEPWYQVTEGLGYNHNVTDIQAALGCEQLARLPEFKQRRQEIMAQYDEAFADLSGLRTPVVHDDVDPMFHLYAVEIADSFGCSRKEFVNAMHAENIYVQVHYVPLHFHPFFRDEYGYERGQFPFTESVYERIVSLPLFPGMTDEDISSVVRAVERLHEYHAD